MKKLFLLLPILLIRFSLSGQENHLELVIDSISRTENKYKSDFIFTITYTLKNKTNQSISFFLKKNTILSNTSSALSNAAIYRLFENDKRLDIPFFTHTLTKTKLVTEENHYGSNIPLDSLMNMHPDAVESYLWQKKHKKLLSEIVTLKPYETLRMSAPLYWNKIRNFTIDDIEYYLNEKENYYVDISLYLLKKPFESYLNKDELEKIIKNPNFIEENVTSNKIEITLQ